MSPGSCKSHHEAIWLLLTVFHALLAVGQNVDGLAVVGGKGAIVFSNLSSVTSISGFMNLQSLQRTCLEGVS
jgi:hypothetical protein